MRANPIEAGWYRSDGGKQTHKQLCPNKHPVDKQGSVCSLRQCNQVKLKQLGTSVLIANRLKRRVCPNNHPVDEKGSLCTVKRCNQQKLKKIGHGVVAANRLRQPSPTKKTNPESKCFLPEQKYVKTKKKNNLERINFTCLDVNYSPL